MGKHSPNTQQACVRMRAHKDFGMDRVMGTGTPTRGSSLGFTLIELMITVAIVGILAAIAYPSYTQYVVRSKRAAAEAFMLELASMQERYMVDNRAYATSLLNLGAISVPADVSPNYQFAITATATPPTYNITATPINSQALRDTGCATLGLTQTGDKTATGTAPARCWN